MHPTVKTVGPRLVPGRLAGRLLRLAASLRLAVVLILALAATLAGATVLESVRGREYVQWHVYRSSWLITLLGLLGLNLLAAMLIRFPWKPRLIPFLVTHCGLLVLLCGAVATFLAGIEGQLALEEGQTAEAMLATERSQLTTVWLGQRDRLAAGFIFQAGPDNWREGKTLDLGELDGVQLTVRKFYRHARTEEQWGPDDSQTGGPAIQLAMLGPDGTPVVEQWLAAGPFGAEAVLGTTKMELHCAAAETLLEDFLDPPPLENDPDGILSVHHQGRVRRIAVRENLGKPVALDDSEIRVEIAKYLPDAKPDAGGKFVSASDCPRNPLLELLVHLPERDRPIRRIAFAKHPLLSLDGIHGWNCPVKFWYHHPAVAAPSDVQFLRTPGGKLYCRVAEGATYLPRGEVAAGDRIDAAGQSVFWLRQYLAHALRKVAFHPVDSAGSEASTQEAAALVELSAGGTTAEVWLKRGDPLHGFREMTTARGPLAVAFGYERLPLGFAVKLVDFQRGMNPGMMGDATFASSVEVIDEARGVQKTAEISMNQPLVHGKYTFYQSSYEELPVGKQVSVLSVSYDPGRFLKYLGSLMICGGVVAMFCRRWLARKTVAGRDRGATVPALPHVRPAAKAAAMLLAVTVALSVPAAADDKAANDKAASHGAGERDWRCWRYLPVQDGGRQKPLDTLAWETCRGLTSRTRVADPETGETLDPTGLCLTLLLSRQGRDQTANACGASPAGTCPGHAPSLPSDRWDHTPLLWVDGRQLRDALQLPADQTCIAPAELARAEIQLPESGEKTAFLAWARKLQRLRPQELAPLQRRALELACRYWSYQELRGGRRLQLLPVPGSPTQEWLSVAALEQTSFDDQSDPTGQLRQLQQQWREIVAAYRAGAAAEFNEASAAFLAAVGEAGPECGDYPSARLMRLEVAHNHWAPFRWAWLLTLSALLCVLLSFAALRRPLYLGALAAMSVGLLAMLVGFALRTAISARAPVTNMYESVVYVGLGTAVIGLSFELLNRKRYLLGAAAAVATVALLVADLCPTQLDPTVRPLPPVLRNNFWLATHVLTITLSYAAFALALAIADVALGYHLLRPGNRQAIEGLSRFVYKSLQIGVVLLALGIVLGAVWADYAWGRFWGWDPKEVWALITLLGYLALLHARSTGWAGDFGLSAWAAVCFSLVVMAWYGVNFVLGSGLHSYGFGGGGQLTVLGVLSLQLLFVATAAYRTMRRDRAAAPAQAALAPVVPARKAA